MMTGIRLEFIQRDIVARRVEDVRDAHQASDQAQMGVRTKSGHTALNSNTGSHVRC